MIPLIVKHISATLYLVFYGHYVNVKGNTVKSVLFCSKSFLSSYNSSAPLLSSSLIAQGFLPYSDPEILNYRTHPAGVWPSSRPHRSGP